MFDNNVPFYKKRQFKQFSLISILIILLFIIYFTYRVISFHLVSINPDINNINTVAPNLSFNFSQKLVKDVKVVTSPNFILSYKVENNEIILNLNIPLKTDVLYKIKISNIQSQNGSKIRDLNYSFRAVFNPNGLNNNQEKTLLQNQANYNKQVYSNSLLQILPFTGPNFDYQIGYTTTNDGKITLQITALGQQKQQEALNFLKSQPSFNQTDYQIQYINAQP